jgi:hypothetical protein
MKEIIPNDYMHYWHEIKVQRGKFINIALDAYRTGAII